MFRPYEKLQQKEELWDLYTRKEEYYPSKLDNHDRFPHSYSSHRDIQTPAVSKYLLENDLLNAEYPEDQPFAVCLTHDVDEIYPPSRHTLLSITSCIKNRKISRINDHLFWKYRGKERSPYRRFKEIMDLEEKYNAHSSFYFLATDLDIRRFRYNIEDLEEELGQIVDRDREVGLHGGYYAYDDLDEIIREKHRLERVVGRKVTGYRNHYLRFKIPHTWRYLEKAGFEYDTTLGYPDTIGFRNGMCHPFLPYDLKSQRELCLLEIPLTIMDGTLFDSIKSADQAWETAKRIIDTVFSCKGVVTINWHSNTFNCPFRDIWATFYEKILEYCHAKKAWMCNAEEIQRWWTMNHRIIS